MSWTDGRTDGRTSPDESDERTDRRVWTSPDEWTNGRTSPDGRTDGRTDKWTDERTNRCNEGMCQFKNEEIVPNHTLRPQVARFGPKLCASAPTPSPPS